MKLSLPTPSVSGLINKALTLCEKAINKAKADEKAAQERRQALLKQVSEVDSDIKQHGSEYATAMKMKTKLEDFLIDGELSK